MVGTVIARRENIVWVEFRKDVIDPAILILKVTALCGAAGLLIGSMAGLAVLGFRTAWRLILG